MNWIPTGKYLLVRLHTRGSNLELAGEVKYDGLATVIAVGPEVPELSEGDVVLLNNQVPLITHPTFDEHVALVPSLVVIARDENVRDDDDEVPF